MRLLERLPAWWRPAALVVLVLAIYLPFLGNSFVTLDDGLLITRNPAVQQLTARSIAYVFSTYDPELYVPLTLLSYQLEHAIAGLTPWVFHLTNILLHAGSAILAYAALTLLLGRRDAALLAAALFAAHPLQTEAVLWAAARKDVLSSFFFLASLTLYLRHRETGSALPYRLSIAAFGLGLLSKVSILLLPVALLLADRLQGRPWSRGMLTEKIPYAVLSLVFGVVALGGKSEAIAGIGPLETGLLAAKNAAFMLGKILLPAGYSVIYPQLTPVGIAPEFLVPVALVLALLACAWTLRKRLPVASFGIALFLLMLVPSFGTFYKNGFLFFASDRYAYLASIGVFVIAAWALARLPRRTFAAAGAALTLALAALSARQGTVWKDSVSLYSNVLALYPGSAMARNNLGDAIKKSGDKAGAEREFRSALLTDPDLFSAHVNLGLLRIEEGKPAEAIAELRLAVRALEGKERLTVDEVPAYYYLAQAQDMSGDVAGSLETFREATRRAPDLWETHYNLGLQLQRRRMNPEAIAAFARAAGLNPLEIDPHYRLAALHAEAGDFDAAIRELERVVSMDPGYERAQEHLGAIRALRGS